MVCALNSCPTLAISTALPAHASIYARRTWRTWRQR